MILVKLTAKQRRGLRRTLRETQDVRCHRRTFAVLQLDRGRSAGEIAESLGVTRQSVYNWARTWESEQRPDGLQSRYGVGRPSVWTDELESLLRNALNERPQQWGYAAMNWTTALLQLHLVEHGGRWLSDDTIRRRLSSWGYVWKRFRYALPPDPEREKKTGDPPKVATAAPNIAPSGGLGRR